MTATIVIILIAASLSLLIGVEIKECSSDRNAKHDERK